MSALQINQEAKIDIITVGQEKTPVIIADNVLQDCSSLIEKAAKQVDFAMINSSMYPGVRAILPKEYVLLVLRTLAPLLYRIYGIGHDKKLVPFGAYYSLVSIAHKELQPIQKIPHFDSSEPLYFAMIHYLNEGSHGGTGFFRHKASGYECITESRKKHYVESINNKFNAQESSEQGYVNQSDENYELYHSVDYRPNRLVLYPGNILHSGLINEETDISADPISGRLTANMFINFK